jgi:hypothetical protein
MFVNRWQTKIDLRDRSDSIIPAIVDCEVRHWNEGEFSRRQCDICLTYGASAVRGSGPDFFEAFCRVRERLTALGLRPLCYGASRNVFPSGMARDMADGLKAYKLRLGFPATGDNIVEIFETGPDVDPVSVEAQRQFFDDYLKSPKQKG